MTRRSRGYWGRVLQDRRQLERMPAGGASIFCEACTAGLHHRCRDRADDEGVPTDCYCRWLGHEPAPTAAIGPRPISDTDADREADRQQRIQEDRLP